MRWYAHTEHWIHARCPVYRVCYESFRKDTLSQLRSLLSWLGYDLPPEHLMAVVQASILSKMRERSPELGPRFFRSGQVDSGMEQFTIEQRRFVMDTLWDLMKTCGYEELLQS